MFEYYSSLFVLIVLSGSSYGKFCDMNENVTRAFIIDKMIYFGDQSNFWRYSISDQKVLDDKPKTRDSIFGSGPDTVDSAVYFNPNDRCKGELSRDNPIIIQTPNFCENTKKTIGLVLAFGNLAGALFGFVAYRLSPAGDLMVTDNNTTMPWKLNSNGTLKGTFWVDDTKADTHHSFTYDEKEDIFYDITSLKGKPRLHWKQLNAYAEFGQYTEANSKLYTGLIDFNGHLFGLGENGNFYQLTVGTDKSFTEEPAKELTAKKFFNCDGDSVLLSLVSMPSPNLNSTISEGNSTQNHSDKDTNEPTQDPNPIFTTIESETTTEKPKSNSMILIFVVIGIIVVVIFAVIVLLFCCMKSKTKEKASEMPNESESEEAQSKLGSKTGSTTSTTTGSKTGSSIEPTSGSKTGSTTVMKTGSKSGSKTGSSIGGGTVKSVKSSASIQSVRSKTD